MRAALVITVGVLLILAATSHAASLSGVVAIKGAPAAEAIVYLESATPAALPAPPAHLAIDQKNLTFVPRVLPVARGTIIDFTNSDNVIHNVFSPSQSAGKFDLGSYSQGETRSVTLSEPGEVLILCNIHMEMEGLILVLRDPYFTVVAADGSFSIAEIPPGAYTLKIWRGRFLSHTQTVQIPATGSLTVQVQAEG